MAGRRITTKSKRRGRIILAAAAMTVPPVLSSAQSIYPPEVEEKCRDDYFRFCSPYALGSDELRRCMEAKGRTLSHSCQQALKDAGLVRPTREDRRG